MCFGQDPSFPDLQASAASMALETSWAEIGFERYPSIPASRHCCRSPTIA